MDVLVILIIVEHSSYFVGQDIELYFLMEFVVLGVSLLVVVVVILYLGVVESYYLLFQLVEVMALLIKFLFDYLRVILPIHKKPIFWQLVVVEAYSFLLYELKEV